MERGRACENYISHSIDCCDFSFSPTGKGQPREIPCSDFEKVYEAWDVYESRSIKRYELGFTQHSVYIISIFHHLGM